jgi:predicted HNH restriction endonuclease
MSSKSILTKNQIEMIASLASQEAIKQYKAQQVKQKKEEKDWRLRNTKLLLENYHRLKDHCDDINQQINDYEDTILSLEELTLETLMRYRIKTAKMMRHFDRMLKHFELDSYNGSQEDVRRYKVIYHRYLSDTRVSIQKLCEMFGVEQGMIYRDSRIAIQDLSVLLFGISAIEFSN